MLFRYLSSTIKAVLGLFALLLGGPEVKMMSRSWVVFAYVVRFPG